MAYENFGFEVDGDGIALITWDMPDRSMNVLSQGSMGDLADIIEKIVGDDAIKGAVLTSGKSAFCAGADLSMMGGQAGSGDGSQSKEERVKALYENNLKFNMLLRRLETCGKPVAAAVNGTALGGGLEVTLACHARIVGDNPKTQLGLPESKVGLLPGGGGTQRLPRLIGAAAALPLLLQGTALKPAKAVEMGIATKLVKPGEEVAEAKAWLKEALSQEKVKLGKRGPPRSSPGTAKATAFPAAARRTKAARRSSPSAMLSCRKTRTAITRRRPTSCRPSMKAFRCRWKRRCASRRATSRSC